jgi:hypothetical protein
MRPDNIDKDKAAAGRNGDRGAKRASKTQARDTPGKSSGGKSQQGNSNDNPVGQMLRSTYQKAVDEAIPAEMLDLLSKLD